MLDMLKRIATRKRTWVVIGTVAMGIGQAVTGDLPHAITTIAAAFVGAGN